MDKYWLKLEFGDGEANVEFDAKNDEEARVEAMRLRENEMERFALKTVASSLWKKIAYP